MKRMNRKLFQKLSAMASASIGQESNDIKVVPENTTPLVSDIGNLASDSATATSLASLFVKTTSGTVAGRFQVYIGTISFIFKYFILWELITNTIRYSFIVFIPGSTSHIKYSH